MRIEVAEIEVVDSKIGRGEIDVRCDRFAVDRDVNAAVAGGSREPRAEALGGELLGETELDELAGGGERQHQVAAVAEH